MANLAKAAARSQPQKSARETGRRTYIGRNGEILKRSEVSGSDPFAFDTKLMEDGWDYQWIAHAVLGDSGALRRDVTVHHQNGWRPVQATGRWAGVFFPESFTGHIVVQDVGLYERPLEMSEDAKTEDKKRALQQMRDRDAALMGGKANFRGNIGDGFEMGGRYRGTGGDIRMSIDPALDAPRSTYQPADE